MTNKTFNRLCIFSLFFTACWFFGNLYEEIVIVPNQLSDTYRALQLWQSYFTVTNPIYYYVPFTQIAVVVIWILFFTSKQLKEKQLLKKAAICGTIAIALTILIVTQINMKLFYGDLNKYKDQLYSLVIMWLFGNALRLLLVGISLYLLFKAYLLKQVSASGDKE